MVLPCSDELGEEAYVAAFAGGPVAMAYSRLDDATRALRARRLLAIHRRVQTRRRLRGPGRVRGDVGEKGGAISLEFTNNWLDTH